MYADTLTVAIDLIRRLEDKDTYWMKEEYQIEIPENRLDEIRDISTHGKFSKHLCSLEGIKTIPEVFIANPDEHAYEEYLNQTWRSVLSVVGASGLPDCNIAGNWLRKSTTLTISIRTSPTINTDDMYNKIKEVLSTDVPFSYKVSFNRPDLSNGWNSHLYSDYLIKTLEESVNEIYNWKPVFKGNGGAIPFVEILAAKLPKAELLVTGASLPDDNAHGPNENLDMISWRNVTSTLAILFTKY